MLYKIIRWIAAIFMFLCAVVYKLSLSSLLFLLCALLLMPIPKLQTIVKKIAPPSWFRILLFVILFVVGAVIAPKINTNNPANENDAALYDPKETQRASINQTKETELTGGGTLEAKLTELENTKTETEAEGKIPLYENGQYKVGTDIPAGIYYIYADTDKWSSSCKLTRDANGNDYVLYESIDVNYIVEIRDGEYFELSNSYAIPYEYAPVAESTDGYLYEGFYVVGVDIPAGEYKVEACEDATWASCAIYADLRDDLEDFETVKDKRYIELKDGQYLKLSDCKIYVGE